MPRKHIYWIIVVAIISFFSVWCGDPYAGAFRYIVRKVRSNAIRSLSERELFDASISGLLGAVDENSSYIPPQTYDELNREFHQEIGSTGVLVYRESETDKNRVGCTLPRSSGRLAGILPGDELVSIDGDTLENLMIPEIYARINVPVGTETIYEIFRPSTRKKITFPLISQRIPIESATGVARFSDGTWNYYLPPLPGKTVNGGNAENAENRESPENVKPAGNGELSGNVKPVGNGNSESGKNAENTPKIMYVRLETFGEKTVQEMRQLLRKGNAENATGLILDLTGNGGGLLEPALAICGMFIPNDLPVVKVRSAKSEELEDVFSSQEQLWKKPVVVLVDDNTASASEILAACLQDYGQNGVIQAICVGERTYGKGTIQDIFDMGPIPDDRYLASETDPRTLWDKIWEKPLRGGFRISVAMYLSPNERMIHRFPDATDADEWGIQPNSGWEAPWKENPRRKENPRKFQGELLEFGQLRVSGGLRHDRWAEVYDFNWPLKRAVEYFY
ncbi:MAG: S41 family peptidase [Planctomycetia bacterium]|nr:S41 family peptidase [Planctomycetia bacterium]